MNARAGWFEVDRAGLARVAGRRTKTFILRELIQNSWDEPSKMVSVEVYAPPKGSGFSTIRVTDDSPEGFSDLRHAYTLFAPSAKVTDAFDHMVDGYPEPRLLEFLIHEYAHDVEANHLSAKYHDTLCKFGGKLARLALERPAVFI